MNLVPFFLVLFAGVFFSEVFRRLHLPWVSALILGGIIIGPFGLQILSDSPGVIDPTVEFIGQVGLIFLMFVAGLETKLSTFSKFKGSVVAISLFNSIIPFSVGYIIGWWFFGNIYTALLLGIIFISSSIAVVVPSLEAVGFLGTRTGGTIIASTIIEDVLSLILLSLLLQRIDASVGLPLPVFLVLLVFLLVSLRFLMPKILWYFTSGAVHAKDIFNQELRAVFTVLIGAVIAFEIIGLHAIVAGFFAGLILSGTITSSLLKDKIRALSYGIFIPVFFILIGAKINFASLKDFDQVWALILAVVLGSMLSKFISGFFGARVAGFSYRKGVLVGVSTIPQLSVTLAVAYSGFEMNLVGEEVIAALVILTMVSTFLAPLLVRLAVRKISVAVV